MRMLGTGADTVWSCKNTGTRILYRLHDTIVLIFCCILIFILVTFLTFLLFCCLFLHPPAWTLLAWTLLPKYRTRVHVYGHIDSRVQYTCTRVGIWPYRYATYPGYMYVLCHTTGIHTSSPVPVVVVCWLRHAVHISTTHTGSMLASMLVCTNMCTLCTYSVYLLSTYTYLLSRQHATMMLPVQYCNICNARVYRTRSMHATPTHHARSAVTCCGRSAYIDTCVLHIVCVQRKGKST